VSPSGRPLCRLAAITVLGLAPAAQAATVLGTVQGDNGQPAAGLALLLSCGDKSVAATTDAQGGYRITIGGAGPCKLSVDGAGADVVLSNQAPAQYDFKLQGRGAAVRLQRR
jgi:hypothetical protein